MSILRKNSQQRLLELVNRDSLLEVADLEQRSAIDDCDACTAIYIDPDHLLAGNIRITHELQQQARIHTSSSVEIHQLLEVS